MKKSDELIYFFTKLTIENHGKSSIFSADNSVIHVFQLSFIEILKAMSMPVAIVSLKNFNFQVIHELGFLSLIELIFRRCSAFFSEHVSQLCPASLAHVARRRDRIQAIGVLAHCFNH